MAVRATVQFFFLSNEISEGSVCGDGRSRGRSLHSSRSQDKFYTKGGEHMEMSKKEAYSEPTLVKHEPLRDITAGATMYGSQSNGPIFNDV